MCAVAAAVSLPLRGILDQANIVMLFLLAVFLVATFLGRGPAVLASFLSVALFDFFFVPPQLSFDVENAQYLITFAVMLAVGLVTAQLVSQLGQQTLEAGRREEESRQLYAVAREMAGSNSLQQVFESARTYLAARRLDADLLLASDSGELLQQPQGHHLLSPMEMSFAQSAYRRNETVEVDSLAGTGVAVVFFPLRATSDVRGVLAITPRSDDSQLLHAQRRALETLASLAALAVERLHLAEATRQAELQVAEERLRTSVLSSLSHDLRTPLTTLVGLADSLAQHGGNLPATAAETAGIIRDQAQAMHRLLSDLLDMARLQGTNSTLRREWQPIEDVIGSALRLVEGPSADRRVAVDIQPDLPLLYFDAVLMERVLCNLLDNAFKYSHQGGRVTLAVARADDRLQVTVGNQGAGFPPDRLDAMFDLFVRGHDEPSIPGVGLGLAICKAIVGAHGGTIRADNVPDGARVSFTLPCATPPPVVEEPA